MITHDRSSIALTTVTSILDVIAKSAAAGPDAALTVRLLDEAIVQFKRGDMRDGTTR
jgi:hypothetical protein